MSAEHSFSELVMDNERLFKQTQEQRERIKKLEELVSLAAATFSEEDVSHYSTAMTFKDKYKELFGKKK